ncbi:MAG: hypothetical protein AAFV93_02505 [Chloroflexota bacterium]
MRDYLVWALNIKESLKAFAAVTKGLLEQHAPALIRLVSLPLLQRFFPRAATLSAFQLRRTGHWKIRDGGCALLS